MFPTAIKFGVTFYRGNPKNKGENEIYLAIMHLDTINNCYYHSGFITRLKLHLTVTLIVLDELLH